MNRLSELQREIETVREELNVAVLAGKGVRTTECRSVSIRMDKLIEAYIQCQEKVQHG